MSEREREPIDVVLDAFFSSLSLVRSRLFRTSVLLHYFSNNTRVYVRGRMVVSCGCMLRVAG